MIHRSQDTHRVGWAGPVPESRRIQQIDLVRGFALFGILLMNWRAPSLGAFTTPAGSRLDAWIRGGGELLAHSKFYPLFGILFGIGMSLQIRRLDTSGVHTSVFLLRRLGVLFCFGLLHQFLIWNGDILHIYAVAGLLLLAVRRGPPWILAFTGCCVITLPELTSLIPTGWIAAIPPPSGLSGLLGTPELDPQLSLSYGHLLVARVTDTLTRYSYVRTYLRTADVAGFFLIGLAIGRSGWVESVVTQARTLRWVLVVGLTLGLAGHGWDFAARRVGWMEQVSGPLAHFVAMVLSNDVLRALVKSFSRPGLALAYAAGLLLLVRNAGWRRLLSPLAAVGRTALSNYLSISLGGAILFYGTGLGLHGSVPWSAGLVLAFGFYGLQILVSHWWLARCRFGPAEWIWRSLTYGRLQPLLRMETRVVSAERMAS